MKKLFFGTAFCMMAVLAFAETVVLDSGRVIEGRVVEVTDEYVRMIVDGQPMRLPFRSMDFDSAYYYRNYQVPAEPVEGEDAAVVADDPDRPKTYRELASDAMQYASQGDFQKAIDLFSQAIALNSDSAALYLFRAGSYLELQKFDQAIMDYGSAIQLDPNNAEYFARRAWAYQLSGRTDDAIVDYSKGLTVDPNALDMRMERYQLLLASGQKEAALEDLTKILDLDPQSVEVYLDLAFLNYQLKQYQPSWENVHQALRHGVTVPPDFITALSKQMPDPFFQEEEKRDMVKEIAVAVRDMVAANAVFFLFALVAGVSAILILFWPSYKKRQPVQQADTRDSDSEKFLRPVLLVNAGFSKRLCAALIDLILLSAVSWAVVVVGRKDVFAVLLGLLYLLKDVFGGVSIGKVLVGLRVVDEHGYRSVFLQGFLRNFTFGMPLIVFYVIFWTAGFRVDMTVRIAMLVVWGCFLFEGLMIILSRKEGRRIGDRMGGIFVHDLHARLWRWPFFVISVFLFGAFVVGTVVMNMKFNKAFLYQFHPLRYYNVEHDFSFSLPPGWKISTEGEGGLVVENVDQGGSLVFFENDEVKDYPLELCVSAFTRSAEDSGLEKKTEEAITVSGMPGFKVGLTHAESTTAVMFIYFKKERWGPLYVFQATATLSTMRQVMSDVMDLVDSFRFE